MLEQLNAVYQAPFAGAFAQLQQVQVAPFAGALAQLQEAQTAPFVGAIAQLREFQTAPLAGVLAQFQEAQTAPFASAIAQLREFQTAPFAGVLAQLGEVQSTSLAATLAQLSELQTAPLAGALAQLRDQAANYAGTLSQLQEIQSAPLAGMLGQIRELQGTSALLNAETVHSILGQLEARPNFAAFVAELDVEDLLAEAEAPAPEDIAVPDLTVWFRGVAAGLLQYGGPVLVVQVLLITWAILAEVGPEARTRFVEIATLVGLAIAVAPAFKKGADGVRPPGDDSE